ncbi:multisite-specific tRNA:(cytosine-C(5))-methyltransferase [Trichomonascus vanleenenianus]|uniref:tRNA (cytosine-C5-)-methyltransferase n=1 Tax=Trichomonascus vanleenenianus TaxID=2268995 RepID=UPI003ECAB95E
MGRKNFRGKGNQRGRRAPQVNWTTLEKENAAWEEYYRTLQLPGDAEFDQFKAACQAPLPLTFRITGSKKHAEEIRDSFEKNYVPHLEGVEWEGEKLEPPTPLKFYPDDLAWSYKVGKQVIRKNQPFARMQRFLVVETEVGNISRQEAVSMIPPLLLDVKPHHSVFDMCAAPGSKTAQLIEAVHSDPSIQFPTGFVVANDSDYKRSHMLIHQVKRLNSPNLIVTNHDAQLFPRILLNDGGNANEYLKFDRILCDVPCSGDATMRKNINVWKDWTVSNGLGLHTTQLNILARGIQLLKPGGRLVYSTCSLNPIENEAVVAEALRQNRDSISLVDVSNELPGLVRCPGISNWKVMGKDKKWKEPSDPGMIRSFFPPTEEEQFNLERSVRVYPHQQDTGGFFIAVFEKQGKDLKREASPSAETNSAKLVKTEAGAAEPAAEKTEESTTTATEKVEEKPAAPAKRMPRDVKDEPFKFLDPEHETLKQCWDFYDIQEGFPRDALLVRNATGDPVRTIYYIAPQLKEILQANEARIKFIHGGIKMFAQQKNDGNCKWRIQNEGLHLIYPSLGSKRVVSASGLATLKELCLTPFHKFDEFKAVDAGLTEAAVAMDEGCGVLKVPYTNIKGESEELLFPLWRGKGSINVMLPKQENQEYLFRFFGVENLKPERPNNDPRLKNEDSADASAEPSAEPSVEPEESFVPPSEEPSVEPSVEPVEAAEPVEAVESAEPVEAVAADQA